MYRSRAFATTHIKEKYSKGLEIYQKVKVLSLPETTKEKFFLIFPLSFQVVREPLPFAYH